MTKDEKYQALVSEAQADPNVIGMILGGGRGKGQFTEHSDYDLELIAIDGPAAIEKYKKYTEKDVIDSIHAFTMDEFRAHAAMGSEYAWDAYNYAHNKPVFDKSRSAGLPTGQAGSGQAGQLQAIIDEKGRIPKGKETAVVEDAIGGYMNLVYRTLKNSRDQNTLASRIDAVEAIPFLLTAIFAAENRIRPYNKFLRWEFENYPVADFPFTTSDFLQKIATVLATGDVAIQKELFGAFMKFFRAKGFTKTIDSWDGYRFE